MAPPILFERSGSTSGLQPPPAITAAEGARQLAERIRSNPAQAMLTEVLPRARFDIYVVREGANLQWARGATFGSVTAYRQARNRLSEALSQPDTFDPRMCVTAEACADFQPYVEVIRYLDDHSVAVTTGPREQVLEELSALQAANQLGTIVAISAIGLQANLERIEQIEGTQRWASDHTDPSAPLTPPPVVASNATMTFDPLWPEQTYDLFSGLFANQAVPPVLLTQELDANNQPTYVLPDVNSSTSAVRREPVQHVQLAQYAGGLPLLGYTKLGLMRNDGGTPDVFWDDGYSVHANVETWPNSARISAAELLLQVQRATGVEFYPSTVVDQAFTSREERVEQLQRALADGLADGSVKAALESAIRTGQIQLPAGFSSALTADGQIPDEWVFLFLQRVTDGAAFDDFSAPLPAPGTATLFRQFKLGSWISSLEENGWTLR